MNTKPGQIFTDPSAYADDEQWHAAASVLRRDDPVHRVDLEGFPLFWAITRHADVLEVERQPELFMNPQAVQIAPISPASDVFVQDDLRTLVQMNGSEHREHRAVTSDWFRKSRVAALGPDIDVLASTFVDRLATADAPVDFVDEIARPFTLQMIMRILGLPPGDETLMGDLTQGIAAATDPEAATEEGATALLMDFFQYFATVAKERVENPGDDLATVLAHAAVGGEPLNDLDRTSYFFLIITAGHDTTTAALSGGMEALLRHPDQLQALRDEPELVDQAVEEIIRWVSPVKHFMREATADCELRGKKLTAGDSVLLSFPSANRDEEVFKDSLAFRVQRENADRHLGFGFGHHFCLGAHLARMELRTFFRQLIPRLTDGEILPGARRAEATVVSGFKHLPVSLAVEARSTGTTT